jgi:hypothetical protein
MKARFQYCPSLLMPLAKLAAAKLLQKSALLLHPGLVLVYIAELELPYMRGWDFSSRARRESTQHKKTSEVSYLKFQ